jgi:hypothetical protein
MFTFCADPLAASQLAHGCRAGWQNRTQTDIKAGKNSAWA